MTKSGINRHHADMLSNIQSFVLAYIADHGYSPTYREIGNAVGISSTSIVGKYVHELAAAGEFNLVPSKTRTLAVTDTANELITIDQRICLFMADGGKVYMNCSLEKPRSSYLQFSFNGPLDATGLRSHIVEVVDSCACDE